MNINDVIIKQVLENNPVALATVTADNHPNVIAVAFTKVIDNKILITDNYMIETVLNIKNNNAVCLAVWNKEWDGYKIIGNAEYFEQGEWLEKVKEMSENKDLPAKGAIIIDIKDIIKLG